MKKEENAVPSEKPNSKDKSERGKKSRAAGQKFETKVRQDLEDMGWIVTKWINTVDYEKNKVVPAKRKYNPFSKVLTIGTGFPDFVCFKKVPSGTYEIIGLEVKSNGYLDQIEKGMCIWLLENKIFSRILIAKKGKNREDNGIEYVDFNKKYQKDAK
jgi:hypothetical protein